MGEVDEVGDLAQANAVGQVADGAAQHQGQGGRHRPVLEGRVEVVQQDGHDADEAGDDQEGALVLEDAEGGAGVG